MHAGTHDQEQPLSKHSHGKHKGPSNKEHDNADKVCLVKLYVSLDYSLVIFNNQFEFIIEN